MGYFHFFPLKELVSFTLQTPQLSAQSQITAYANPPSAKKLHHPSNHTPRSVLPQA